MFDEELVMVFFRCRKELVARGLDSEQVERGLCSALLLTVNDIEKISTGGGN